MNIRPLHVRMVIRRVEADTKTAGGILLPSSASVERVLGEVIAVGKGKFIGDTIIPVDVKVGDKVVFRNTPKHGMRHNSIKVDDEDLLIVDEEDILAVLEG